MLLYNIMEDGLEQHRSLLLELERLEKEKQEKEKQEKEKNMLKNIQ